jgi:hypothetical protein
VLRSISSDSVKGSSQTQLSCFGQRRNNFMVVIPFHTTYINRERAGARTNILRSLLSRTPLVRSGLSLTWLVKERPPPRSGATPP